MATDETIVIEFRQRLAAKAQKYYWRRDIAGIISVLEQLERMAAREKDIKKKLALDSTIAHVLTLAAEAHLDELDFQSCFELCQCAVNVLNEAVEVSRLNALDKPYQGTSWCGLVTILADAKWKVADAAYKEMVVPMEEMFSRYTTITANAIALIRDKALAQNRIDGLVHTLLWCGVMHLKLAMRFNHSFVTTAVNLLNDIVPGVLDDSKWPYYWDVEITKAVLNRSASRPTLAFYYANRLKCIERTNTDRSELAAYKRAAAKEMEYLLSCQLASN